MNRQEFERLALEQMDAVYRMAFHLCHSAERAEELVQEVYVRALRPSAVETFEPESGGIRPWLFVICHNIYYSQGKSAARDAKGSELIDDAVDARPGPDEAPPAWDRATMNWEHVDGRLKRAIERLKPEFREVLLLWAVEGLKYREIAEVLGVRLGTVMSRLHRARRMLADELTSDPSAKDELRLPNALPPGVNSEIA